jgi:hypothetical protein
MIHHSVHCDPPRNAFLLSPLFLFFLSLTSNIYTLGILVKYFIDIFITKLSRESVVGTATGYGLDDRGVVVRVPLGARIFSSPGRPDRLWGPPNLLTNGYGGSFHEGKAAGTLITHLQLVSRSRKCGSIYPLSHSWRSA